MEYIVNCGKPFVNFVGQHYVPYRGDACYTTESSYVEVPVDSRITVDVSYYFRKVNPNYRLEPPGGPHLLASHFVRTPY
jgi:hypothetical protein